MRVPAVSVSAMLDGLDALGLRTDEIRHRVGLGSEPPASDATLPVWAFQALVEGATAQSDRPTLAFEAGMAVPVGAFGVIDYLALTSETIRSSLLSLQAHFAALASVLRVEVDEGQEDLLVRVAPVGAATSWGREFCLGAIYGRFREHVSATEFAFERPEPEPAFEALVGVPVRFGASSTHFRLATDGIDRPQYRADPRLNATLAPLASGLVARMDETRIETAVRARLQDLLPQRRADAASVARLLGISERTLFRRLTEAGTTFREVADRVLAEQSERLLARPELSLAQIANDLGYADQSAWTKAFRRWKGTTPAAWRKALTGAPSTQAS